MQNNLKNGLHTQMKKCQKYHDKETISYKFKVEKCGDKFCSVFRFQFSFKTVSSLVIKNIFTIKILLVKRTHQAFHKIHSLHSKCLL